MLDPKVLQYCKEDVINLQGFDRSEFVEAREGYFEFRAYPGPDCGNNIGTVHGGFLLALADMAGAGVVDTLGRENATMSVNVNFLRPARTDDEYLQVVGTIIHAGHRSAVTEVCIKRPGGEVVLKGTCTVAIFDSSILDSPVS